MTSLPRRSAAPASFAPSALAATALLGALLLGCAGDKAQGDAPKTASGAKPNTAAAKVLGLQVSPESLRVDKVGMRDGALHPDGSLDLVFLADVEGPLDAIFIVATDEKGVMSGLFRANTLVGAEEAPEELGGTLELGRMTSGIGVMEDGKWINRENGSIGISEGRHHLTLYVANTGALHAGVYLRLIGRVPGGGLVKGPVISY